MPFDRPEHHVIRGAAREILSEPRFSPQKTLVQMLLEWVQEKLGNWRLPDIPPGLAEVLYWVLLIWCILTLAAIVAHLIWTLFVLCRAGKSPGRLGIGGNDRPAMHTKSFAELWRLMDDLAGRGAYRQAITVMMLGILRWLDSVRLVHFHESKTNGDYVREYAKDQQGADEFRQFVLTFDQTIYGAASCGRRDFEQLHTMVEQVQDRVRQKT